MKKTGTAFTTIVNTKFPGSDAKTVVSVVEGRYEGLYGFLALVDSLKNDTSLAN